MRTIDKIENVFILGAGASVEAGAPLMNNFMDISRKLLRDIEPSNGIFANGEIDHLMSVFSKLQNANAKGSIDIYNIESILGALEMAEILDIELLGEKKFNLKDSYLKMIYYTLTQTMQFELNRSNFLRINAHESYYKFIELFEVLDNSAILTFNYDLGLDVALTDKQIDYSYYLNEEDNEFPLLKLHGSLNWFNTTDNNVKSIQIKELLKKVRPSHDQKTIPLDFVDYKRSFDSIKIKEEVPFIIPPTWNKTMFHSQISSVWQAAARCLRTAQNIYVIGYSFPQTDMFFRYLYSLGTLSNSIINRFWIFDIDAENSAKRFKENLIGQQLINSGRFEPIKCKFSEVSSVLMKRLDINHKAVQYTRNRI